MWVFSSTRAPFAGLCPLYSRAVPLSVFRLDKLRRGVAIHAGVGERERGEKNGEEARPSFFLSTSSTSSPGFECSYFQLCCAKDSRRVSPRFFSPSKRNKDRAGLALDKNAGERAKEREGQQGKAGREKERQKVPFIPRAPSNERDAVKQ